MDNPEKLETLGTQVEDKQTQPYTICVGHYYTQTNTNDIDKSSYKQLEAETGRTSFLCLNRNVHHITERRM